MPSKRAFLFLDTSHSTAAPKGRWLLRREIFVWLTTAGRVWIHCVCVCVYHGECRRNVYAIACHGWQYSHTHRLAWTHTHLLFIFVVASILASSCDPSHSVALMFWLDAISLVSQQWRVIIYCCRGIRGYTLINQYEAILLVLSPCPQGIGSQARQMRRREGRALCVNSTASRRHSTKEQLKLHDTHSIRLWHLKNTFEVLFLLLF